MGRKKRHNLRFIRSINQRESVYIVIHIRALIDVLKAHRHPGHDVLDTASFPALSRPPRRPTSNTGTHTGHQDGEGTLSCLWGLAAPGVVMFQGANGTAGDRRRVPEHDVADSGCCSFLLYLEVPSARKRPANGIGDRDLTLGRCHLVRAISVWLLSTCIRASSGVSIHLSMLEIRQV
jgi:hypothetical protein